MSKRHEDEDIFYPTEYDFDCDDCPCCGRSECRCDWGDNWQSFYPKCEKHHLAKIQRERKAEAAKLQMTFDLR